MADDPSPRRAFHGPSRGVGLGDLELGRLRGWLAGPRGLERCPQVELAVGYAVEERHDRELPCTGDRRLAVLPARDRLG